MGAYRFFLFPAFLSQGGTLMKKRCSHGLSLGLLAAITALACILGACPTVNDETTHVVTFNVDGGSAVPNQTVTQGGRVTKPTDPTKAGNTFAGWHRDAAKTIPWNFATDTVTADTTLYARWTGNIPSFTVTFNADGGSAVQGQTVTQGGTVTKPADPTKANHTFAGWHKDAAKTILWNFATDTVTADTTLYARWTENIPSFTVTFNADGGSAVPNQTVAQGGKVTEPTGPTREGYTFAGWHSDDAKTILWNFATDTVTADTTLYARWTENIPSFTVTFNADGGSAVPNQTVTQGGKVTRPPDPSKEGYTFDGWYNENALWDFTTNTITGNITLTARWTAAITIKFTGFSHEEIDLSQEDGQTLSQNNYDSLTVSVSGVDGSSIAWFVDGEDSGWGYTASLTVYAWNLSLGPHTLSAVVEKNGEIYSKTLKFLVTE
jgi:uncharacterized repeat protein (TIGR02543 family)